MTARLMPDAKVRKRYGVTAMTGWRWDRDPDLGFPKPMWIQGRKYRSVDELDEFDARMRRNPIKRARPGSQ
jgi:hypothetical protein